MSPPCALCKGRNPRRTHVFPQNSRAEVQQKWVKALGLPQNQEDAVLAEMREMEQKGNRPRWCTFHFDYDSAGIHFPKYFDPEEGKTAQGWKEGDDDEKEEEGPSTQEKSADDSRDRSSTPNEPRRSSRKRTSTAAGTASTSPEPLALDRSLQKILINAGISLPGVTLEDSPPKVTPSMKRGGGGGGGDAATSMEKTLQSIIMEAGLPVPETLQAKTGVLVEEGKDERVLPRSRPARQFPIGGIANTITTNSSITVGDAKRLGTFVPGAARGGMTLSSPKMLANPMASKFTVVMPKPIAPKMPSQCYNHNTMEKYDESDSLRNFKMPCTAKDCRSELTVIMERARALEDQFDDLSNNVLHLVQMYRTKTPIAFRPPQSLATIQGRAAAVAGPVYGMRKDMKNIPLDSLAVQERRDKRTGGIRKEPERLLTDDDLASTVRRRVAMQEHSEEDEDEDAPELDDDDTGDDDWKPSSIKKPRRASARDADTASEASPPMLDKIE